MERLKAKRKYNIHREIKNLNPMPINFSILPEDSEEKGFLVIAFYDNENFQKSLTVKEALAKASLKEKEVINELIKASHEPTETLSIAPSKTFFCLKQLAATGRFFLKKNKLVSDFFSNMDLIYHIKEVEPGTFKIFPFYGKKETPQPLSEVDFLFSSNPSWIIKGPLLKTFKADLEAKWIKKIKKNELLLTQKELDKLIHEINESQDFAPLLILDFEKKDVAYSYVPLVKLKDRFGSEVELQFQSEQETMSYAEMLKKDKALAFHYEKDLLESGYEKKGLQAGLFSANTEKAREAIYFLLECGFEMRDYLGKKVLLAENDKLQLAYEKSAVFLKGQLKFGGNQKDVESMVASVRRDEPFLQLSSSEIGLIPKGAFKQIKEALRIGKEVSSKGIQMEKALCFNEKLLDSFSEENLASDLILLKKSLSDFSTIAEKKPEALFKGHLRPYQQQGLNWLNFLKEYHLGGLLADDMGLGKTVQVIALLSLLDKDALSLIVVPTSLIYNWERECKRFLPAADIYIHSGKNRLNTWAQRKDRQIALTSYALLREDLEFFKQQHYSVIILDEAQNIKNARTKTATSVFALRGDLKIAITGTPVENRLDELFSIFQFVMPPLVNDKLKSNLLTESQGEIGSSRKKFKPFILRRTKDEVAKELPEKIEQTILLEMDESERLGYEKLLAQEKDFLKELLDEDQAKPMQIFELLLRLRQYACHPLLVSSLLEEKPPESSKFNTLIEDLQEISLEGHKVLFFSQFTKVLDLVARELSQKGISFSRLDGSQSIKERELNINRFKENPDIPCFLISLSAGGVGLNLPEADYVILYEPWWNEARENQAIDRAHRIGRERPVLAKRYIYTNSIEEKIMLLKEKKKKLSEFILEDDLKGHLSKEDWNFLFDF